MEIKIYVQYGSGPVASKKWRNFDASPRLKFERVPIIGKLSAKKKTRFSEYVECGDITKGLPVSSDSCQGVYASHVLEHLSLNDFRIALKNTYKILRSNGIFRLVVPDLEILAKSYVESSDPNAAEIFMKATSLGVTERSKSFWSFLKKWLGNSVHLWMWDYKGLKHELSDIGFIDIRRCSYGDSTDPMFKCVEVQSRFVNAVAVECRKP